MLDVVARPRDEAEIEAVLLHGAPTSGRGDPVRGRDQLPVGGVEPRVGNSYAGAVTIDLGALDRVLEVDRVHAPRESRPARSGRT